MVDEANQAFGGPPGRAGLVAHVKGFRRNIEDLNIEIQNIVGNTDESHGLVVVSRYSCGALVPRRRDQ